MERKERKNEIREGGVHERESERGLLPRCIRQIVKIEIGQRLFFFKGSSQTKLGHPNRPAKYYILSDLDSGRTKLFSWVGPNAGEMSVGGIRKRQEGERRRKVTETRSDVRSSPL